MKVIEKTTGKPVPEVKFFNMVRMTIAGKEIWALRHGMVGQPGIELFGPWADGETVRQTLIDAGKPFGMALVGGRAYSSNTLGIRLDSLTASRDIHRRVDERVSRVAACERLRSHIIDRR